MAILRRAQDKDNHGSSSEERIAGLEAETERLRSAVNELTLLNDLAVSVGIEQDLDRVLDGVVRRATRAVRAEQGSVSLTTRDSSSPLKTLVRNDEKSRLRNKYRIGDYIAGWVLLNREPLLITDLSREKRFKATKEELELIHSVLCIPIVVKAEMLGVLLMINKIGGDAFTTDDLRFLNIIATQSGQLIRIKQLQQVAASKEKEAERARAESEKLHELDELKSRFTANISHDLRTPLTLIIGPLKEMMAVSRGSVRRNLDLMLRNAERLLALVDELLDLSRIDAGSVRLSVSCADIYRFVSEVVESFQPLAEQKSISLRFESGLQETTAYFDSEKVEKMLCNLLSNAFKFTGDRGAITVSVSRASSGAVASGAELSHASKDYIEICVSDNGIGIPEDQTDKIFERFYRAYNTNTVSGNGSGIGLSLVKELVDLHHGEIWVSSEVGRGARFTVILPAGADGYEAAEFGEGSSRGSARSIDASVHLPRDAGLEKYSFADAKKSSRHPRPTILIVEDNEDVRNYIRKCTARDYRTIATEDGEQGLKTALEVIPDLVLSDVMMPGMDGYGLCGKLKTDERTSHIPVILLTARAGIDDKINGLGTGADDYIVKPFDPEELLARISNLIQQRKKLRERFSREITLEPKESSITSVDERFLTKMMGMLEEHLSDPAFGVETLGREMGMSRVQLYRKIKALTDQSANDFIRTMRLKRAAQMLRMHGGNVSEVCYSVGFDSPSYFARCFRRLYGKRPSEYVFPSDK